MKQSLLQIVQCGKFFFGGGFGGSDVGKCVIENVDNPLLFVG